MATEAKTASTDWGGWFQNLGTSYANAWIASQYPTTAGLPAETNGTKYTEGQANAKATVPAPVNGFGLTAGQTMLLAGGVIVAALMIFAD